MAAPADATPHYEGNSSIKFKVHDDHKKEMRIPAKDLNVVWGNDPRYWKKPDNDNSSLELNQVYWLEVTTCVDETDPKKTYEVGFDVSLSADAFGWGDAPLYLMVRRGKDGKFVWKKHLLTIPNHNKEEHREIIGRSSSGQHEDPKLHLGLFEVWSGKWKGGLKINHAFVREL
ncbi:protein phloem protein 2-like a9 [Phtheirospermum japonicum]|uniref:Protein phloem protein 2-like a9 n=1 Tax=Phtheirospermum japonicum TaxID=374723 RepID=A0A830BAZ3_9LAMI|nr:protein phloem protein 2-like a9 [Phtheirospermum japonicum]